MKAFISYSHADELALKVFVKHLAMLKREKLLSEWFDQEILAGGRIDAEISKNLESCELFVPLLSPDFLASNYCYEREMIVAIEREEAGKLQIVPIVVQPCDWLSSPVQRYKALPKDSKPVSDWTNENTAWLNVITELRRLLERPRAGATVSAPKSSATGDAQKYRLKRDFDEVDKMEFRDSAFAAMRDYFEKACAEVATIDGIKSRFSSLGDDGFTCTVVNRARRQGTAHITVYSGSKRHSLGDIYYSFQERAERNTANGWFAIENDDYSLFLKQNDMMSSDRDQKLTPHACAEQLWNKFLGQAGIENG